VSLKDFNQYVVMTPGNAGTLDMLNRGEIRWGPVWVDMFYTWQADGKLNREGEGSRCPRRASWQPMYYVIRRRPQRSRSQSSLTSREPRGPGERLSVKRFTVPGGIDAQHVQSKMAPPTGNKALHRHLAAGPGTLRRRSGCRSTSPTSSRATSASC